VVGLDGVGLLSVVVVGVDGAGRAGAELDVELRPAKEFHVQLSKHTQIKWPYFHILYNQVYPEFRVSNHHENMP
jgi:hypothetical protein